MIEKSSEEQALALRELVQATQREIRELVDAGEKVHLIWDFDFVLGSGRSDDVFALFSADLPKYFEYEERLSLEPPEAGPWVGLAEACGILHHSQDIVSSRSSFLALRLMLFLLSWNIPSRWQLFVGHQSKRESYGIILDSLKGENWRVFMVDDADKHVNAFREVAEAKGWGSRAKGIIAPRLRTYSEEELRAHVDAVMSASEAGPVDAVCGGRLLGRWSVLPGGRDDLRRKLVRPDHVRFHMEELVERLRPSLEKLAEEGTPGEPMTVSHLFWIHEVFMEHAMRQWDHFEAGMDAVLYRRRR
ncbi:MAG: hypothetical protein HYT14_00400 [Candidatus Liptonbacteria bacterium]|nr:hypothetical protein [Candidatus Liptonbacteria bacterium]